LTDQRSLVALYAGALFLSAVLLFGMQPLIVKMALPRLGGSPAVWNAAQVFFQALLLAGYLYAHLLSRLRAVRGAVVVHVLLLLGAFATLPVALPGDWQPPVSGSPIPSLLGALALSVGLPFFAVATTAPLLQNWFSRSGHGAASDPYFLYSSSNLGGLLALLGYPFVIEPWIGLIDQGEAWAAAYAVLVVLIVAAVVRSLPLRALAETHAEGAPRSELGWSTRLRWLALAFAPSALMLGVTLHISTDIAAAPFIWVLPLALYLLTWVITFSRRPVLAHRWMLAAQVPVIAMLVVFFTMKSMIPGLALHVAAFFITTMVCHGELARTRPHVTRLTEFYLWIAVGGVLGGAFSGLLAPVVFDSVLEYPLALVLACALRPSQARPRQPWRDLAVPAGLALAYLAATWAMSKIEFVATGIASLVVALGVAMLLWTLHPRTLRFALAVGLLLVVVRLDLNRSTLLLQERSFFGVHRVLSDEGDRFRLLTHGNTVHGVQRQGAPVDREPLAYYTRQGPAGQVFAALHHRRHRPRVSVVGLGSGALSCLHPAGPGIHYFEIDPVVVRIARNARYLSYLENCGARDSVTPGDGRRSLAVVPDGSNDLLVLDAFSSDAIPAHLLTVEAMTLYGRKLAPGGVLLVHLSNRHLDLDPVAVASARAAGMEARLQIHHPRASPEELRYRWPSVWMIAAHGEEPLQPYLGSGDWTVPEAGYRPWTDDYSDVAGALRWDHLW
jgi:hypothetical protein